MTKSRLTTKIRRNKCWFIHARNGFTLVEILLAVTLSASILTAVYGIYDTLFLNYRNNRIEAEMRSIEGELVDLLRYDNAEKISYDPVSKSLRLEYIKKQGGGLPGIPTDLTYSTDVYGKLYVSVDGAVPVAVEFTNMVSTGSEQPRFEILDSSEPTTVLANISCRIDKFDKEFVIPIYAVKDKLHYENKVTD